MRAAAMALLDAAAAVDAPVEAIARLSMRDGTAGVREACLRHLATAHSAHDATRTAVGRGFADPSPRVRLLAATAPETHGVPAVHGVAARRTSLLELLDAAHPDEVGCGAAEALASSPAGRQLLKGRLTDLTGRVRQRAAALLAEHGELAHGALALVEPAGGGLALAVTTGGQLSPADGPPDSGDG